MSILYSRVELYKKLSDVSWSSSYDVLGDASKITVMEGIGKVKDNFSFRILNANNNLYKTYYNGDGSSTIFNLRHFPIPAEIQVSDIRSFGVFLKISGIWNKISPSDFSINNTLGTITFSTAPSAGQKNIRIDFTVIESDDIVKIYNWKDKLWNSMTTSERENSLLMQGTIKDPAETINDVGGLLEVRGVSWIETLFNTNIQLDCISYTSAEVVGGSVVTAGKSGILNMQQLQNEYRKVYWHPDNPTKKKDGSDFPNINFIRLYKPAIECLDEVSTDKYTKDGQYIIYIKNGNANINPNEITGRIYLIWKPKPLAIAYTIEDHTPTQVKIGKPVDDVVNAIIFNAGKDCYNHSIHYLRYNTTSIGAVGAKWKYVQLAYIAPSIVQDEYDANKTLWARDTNGARTANFPATYPYTFQFETRDPKTGDYTGTTATAVNDSEFNNVIRIEAKWRGWEYSGILLDIWANPRYRATVDLPRVDGYTRGELILLKVIRYNFNDVKNLIPLRLHQIMHTFWETQLQMEEDEETARAQVI